MERVKTASAARVFKTGQVTINIPLAHFMPTYIAYSNTLLASTL